MEYLFPTLQEREDIKEEVAKWIQYTIDQKKISIKLGWQNVTSQNQLVKHWQRIASNS